jgi:hypothetical protein
MEKGFAERFAKEWVAAWNSHDLERVLAHYEDNFEMSSPIITTLIGEPSGKLRGKASVGAYWAKALRAIPDLRFELLAALAGVNSVTVYYQGHRGLAAAALWSERQSERSVRALCGMVAGRCALTTRHARRQMS